LCFKYIFLFKRLFVKLLSKFLFFHNKYFYLFFIISFIIFCSITRSNTKFFEMSWYSEDFFANIVRLCVLGLSKLAKNDISAIFGHTFYNKKNLFLNKINIIWKYNWRASKCILIYDRTIYFYKVLGLFKF